MELQYLKDNNPWKEVEYHVANKISYRSGWICPKDADEIEKSIRSSKCNLNLAPNPVPWAGRWNNDELPRLVILGLNPGSGYDNDIKDGNNLMYGGDSDNTYSDLVNKNLKGEAGLGELIFSKAMHDRSSYYPSKCNNKDKKVSYWVEKLYPLYQAIVDSTLTKDNLYYIIQKKKDTNENAKAVKEANAFFNSILTVELFPYHTKKGNEIGKLFEKDKTNEAEKEEERKNGKPLKYPSSKFNVDLVKYMIENKVPVIVARAWDKWYDALGENYIRKCYRLNNPQNITISENNLTPKFIPPCWACQNSKSWSIIVNHFKGITPPKNKFIILKHWLLIKRSLPIWHATASSTLIQWYCHKACHNGQSHNRLLSFKQ